MSLHLPLAPRRRHTGPLAPVRQWMGALSCGIILAGCAVQPQPLGEDAHSDASQRDRERLAAATEPLDHPVTLAEATARAIRFNMDYRQRMMEEGAAARQLDVANWDMLPKFTLQAGYTARDNDAFSYGVQPDGTKTVSPSTAVERRHWTDSAVFSWNILDFGLSYYRSKQLADQVLIAEERRRKALQNLVQDVRYAWWRAESAERLLPQVDAFLREVDLTIARARLIENRRLLPPIQIIGYRRALLDLAQQITQRRQDLAAARVELATLMNIGPGTPYTIATLPTERQVPDFTAHIDALENLALINRPELREERYRARITDLEHTRTQWSTLVPGLGVDAGYYHDSNRFLVNNSWEQAGIAAAFNLVKVFSLPAIDRSFAAQRTVDEARRLALSSAVITQTRIAAVRFQLLKNEFDVWDEALRDDEQIIRYLSAANQIGLETELEIVRAKARRMVTLMNRDAVHAGLQAAMGRVAYSVGVDSLPDQLDDRSTEGIARALIERVASFESAHFKTPEPVQLRPVRIAAPIGMPDTMTGPFTTALQRALTMARIPTSGDAPAATIETRIDMDPAQDSSRLVKMRVRVVDAEGRSLLDAEQRSMLIEPLDNPQWSALGEGVAYRVIVPILRHLGQPAIVR